MQHQFPEGFKPVNIESYDGTTDPAVWIEDFLLRIHMALGDDLHAIKYLPLRLKGPARYWLNSLPENSIGSWEDLEEAFLDNIQGTYVRPPDADDLSRRHPEVEHMYLGSCQGKLLPSLPSCQWSFRADCSTSAELVP